MLIIADGVLPKQTLKYMILTVHLIITIWMANAINSQDSKFN